MPNYEQERNEETEALRLGLELTGKLMNKSFDMSNDLLASYKGKLQLSVEVIALLITIIEIMQGAISSRDREHGLGTSAGWAADRLAEYSNIEDFEKAIEYMERMIKRFREAD